MNTTTKKIFMEGMRDGLPIGLGYFAVSFSLGIVARNAGLNAFQGFLASLLTNASAGEYAIFTLIAANATYFEVAIMTLITNARYLLMSCALSQRFSPKTGIGHRLLLGYDITDELFGITIARPGMINPFYTYGAMCLAVPGWSIGTALGVIAGNILPYRVVSALSVALYGMFIAIIIPPVRTEIKNLVSLSSIKKTFKDKLPVFYRESPVTVAILISFLASYLFNRLPCFDKISSGNKTILLTVVISSVIALLHPVKNNLEDPDDES
ncbi:MAG: AzlC family ABC transporter permease [Lachnospiraceae bacterium]|jgi:predicted branched-subunit amino acid permease|nr:AzlC family ABC transporter permease [Lachnospiraceae bacterium]